MPLPCIIDDRTSESLTTPHGTQWRAVCDQVMGGVSSGELRITRISDRACLQLTGTVHLENNGGFVQASLDLSKDGVLDASGYVGIEIEVCGNLENYHLHLRTADTSRVWQSYRVHFQALSHWQTLRFPFADFLPHRIDTALDQHTLRRLGVVAIGKAMQVNICFGRIALYRANAD